MCYFMIEHNLYVDIVDIAQVYNCIINPLSAVFNYTVHGNLTFL